MSLHGDLAEMPIGELLQTLALNNHEGTLKIHSEKEGDRYFFLSKGEIQLVSPGKRGLRLGEALVKQGKITQADLDKALARHNGTGQMLGRTLIDLQLIAEDEIEAVVRQQFREEFFAVFLLTRGAFEFYFHTRPEQLIQFDDTVSRVSLNTSSLMLEALRQIDEWQLMSKAIATPRAIFKVVSDSVQAIVEELDFPEDVRQAVALIDGKRTIAEIVEKTPATKFDVYALLHRLYERKAIRPLTAEECSDGALGAEVGGDTYGATVYYEFATFLDPTDFELRERQFNLLKRLNIYKEAKEAALAIADHKVATKDYEAALQFYLEAQACDDKDLRAAEGVFRASLLIGTSTARSAKAGDELVKLALRSHDVVKAREALGALVDLEPKVHRRRLELADLCDDDREGRARAVRLLEEAIEGLQRPDDAPLKAEACRRLLKLDARRSDVQDTLRGAVAAEEDLQKRRVRKIVALNAAALLLIAAAYAGSYEIGARRALAGAADVEAKAAGAPAQIQQAEEAYRFVSRAYPYSTVSSGAEEAARRLRAVGTAAIEEERRRAIEERTRRETSAKDTRRQAAVDLLRHAEALELRGSYEEAAQAKFEVLRDYADVKLDQRIRLPIPIATEPPGATVRSGSEELGTTPCVIYAEPGTELRVRVERPGFGPREVVFKADRFEKTSIVLNRAALWTYRTEGAIEAAPLVAAGRVIVVSRDGQAYGFDAANGEVLWKNRLGEYGDSLSPPSLAGGKCLVGTTEGTLAALDPATGVILFTFDAGGAVRGEVRTGPDGLLAGVGSAAGLAHFVRSANGELVFSVKTDRRIDAPIEFGGGRAYVASRDGRIRAVDLKRGSVAWTFDGAAPFLSAPLLSGDVLVAGSSDGNVLGLSAADGTERWRVPTAGRIRGAPVRAGALVAVPSEDGALYGIDARTGSTMWRFPTDAPLAATPVVTERGIYVVSTAGTVFRVDPARGTSDFRFSVGSSVRGSPAVASGRIFVGSSDGAVRAILE